MGTLVLAGRYEIIEKIGDGGMALVFKARDRQLNRFVAIKILKKEFITDQIFVENFIREARAAASLLHPNIVTIHDAGKDRDIYYIVMEYIEGRPLSDLIAAEAPLDYKRCIRIAKQVASALYLAHRNNIIHRDVKPHNILMTLDGTAKITDFGIAKAVSDGTIINDSGVIMGSVHYFSPEQSRGQYVDEKSDIYSLGIVLYEMITGQVPFDADNPVTIAVMHMNDTIIPPSRLVKGVPPGLDQIVMKATAKFQSDRFGNIEEMYKALDNVNFITGIIDDPEIARYVKPTTDEERPGSGYSNAAEPDEDEYKDEPYHDYEDTEEPDYRKRASRKKADDDYYEYDEDDDEDDLEKKPGLFAGLFGGGSADKARGRDGREDRGESKLDQKQKMILVIAVIGIAVALSFPLSKVIAGMFNYEPEEVPEVVGLYENEARDLLEAAGFVVNVKYEPLPYVEKYLPSASDDMTEFTDESLFESEPVLNNEPAFKVGQVMDQNPKGGDLVKPGTKVTLTIASEPEGPNNGDGLSTEMLEVPDLIGKSKASAEYAIKAAGFLPGIVSYENSDQPVDTVIAQSPRKGEKAPGNSKINFVICKGPKENMVTVPKLIGRSYTEAEQLATAGKFKLNVSTQYSKDFARDLIVSQDPAEKSEIKEGGLVNIVVSLGGPISNISVSGPSSITKGEKGNFSASVSGEGAFSEDVNWSISGSDGSSSISGNGVLSVDADEGASSITVIATSIADNSKSGRVNVSLNTAQYTLTVVNGSGSGSVQAGKSVNINANPPAGKKFNNWESSGGGTFGDKNNPSTTFTMPAGNVTVTAVCVDMPPTITSITISAPSSTVSLSGGGTLQFTATVAGTGSVSQEVSWSTNKGSISASGLLNVSSLGVGDVVEVKAISNQDTTKYGTMQVTVDN